MVSLRFYVVKIGFSEEKLFLSYKKSIKHREKQSVYAKSVLWYVVLPIIISSKNKN